MSTKEIVPTKDMAGEALVASRRSRAANGSPPLESGDRLTRREFERRYRAMPKVRKAELIEGVVFMPSPVRTDSHAEPHAHIMTWLGTYVASTPTVRVGDNSTVRLDGDNEVQPDALLWVEPSAGGQARLGPDGYLEGAPELIVEVAASSAAYDMHDKLKVYRRNGVREYVVWQIEEAKLDWFEWNDGEYEALMPDSEGVIQSRIFPGLRLAVPALLRGDLALVLSDLQVGLASAVHAAFVQKLAPGR